MADVDVRDVSVAELIHRMSDQSTTLLRQEMRLIQAEMEEKAQQAKAGAGLLTAAGVAGLGAFGAFVAGLILAIGQGLAMWLSAFIVAAGLVLVAAVIGLSGKEKVASVVPPKPEEAIDSIRADLAEMKEAAAR
ncbi:MAG TPA: phage holin family protein [Acidimicrobiia bacterium]|nr:phage holin family protein [Acidimicrobiia bacterium]HZQ79307.1 phage holin family protein [Acidimicrobiia bacterium]